MLNYIKECLPGKDLTPKTVVLPPKKRRHSDLSSNRTNMGLDWIDNGMTYRSYEHQDCEETIRSNSGSPKGSPKAKTSASRKFLTWRWWYLLPILAFVLFYVAPRTYYEYSQLPKRDWPQSLLSSIPNKENNEDVCKISTVDKDDLNAMRSEQLDKMHQIFSKFNDDYELRFRSVEESLESSAREMHREFISSLKTMMEQEYQKMKIDPVGLPDYALAYNGAKVADHSPTHLHGRKVRGPFNLKLFYEARMPEIVIEKSSEAVMPGNCWPFVGNTGFVTIELPEIIVLSSISYEHAPLRLIPSEEMKSAPKGIEIWAGLDSNASNLVGEFTYEVPEYGASIFNLPKAMPAKFVKFSVLDNHGHMDYTCLYRIRAYGQPI